MESRTCNENKSHSICHRISNDKIFIVNFILYMKFREGGPSTVILSFLGEFHADKPRTKAICYTGFFWAFAKVILPGKLIDLERVNYF